jgi:hypothetical protein
MKPKHLIIRIEQCLALAKAVTEATTVSPTCARTVSRWRRQGDREIQGPPDGRACAGLQETDDTIPL